MRQIKLSALFALLLLAGSVAEVSAQNPAVRIRGEVVKVDGQNVVIKGRDGTDYTLKLPEKPRVMALVKASLADIKPNSYIGVTAMPQADGSQRAIAIHIFLEAQRGTAEGHMPWDLQPQSTMTNATVDTMVKGVDGDIVTVKYKDGEKKIIVPAAASIVAYSPGDLSEIKPGTQVIVFGARKDADGAFAAPGINFGRDGVTPPM